MSEITVEPEPPVSVADVSPAAPVPGSRAVRVTAIVALVGILVALVGLFLGTRPLATSTQDCGTPATFLLRGKQNVFVDPGNPPKGTNKAEAEANNDTPCQERAFNRALPAGILVVGGTLVALISLLAEFAVRFHHHRAARMTAWKTPPEPLSP